VTDASLGDVRDVAWIDGYYMTTDGEFLVVTELNDPFSVNPLKYASAEASPDPIVAVLRIRNEIYAVGETTIEVFNNVGGANFPFQRNSGAQVQKGATGPRAACVFQEAIAFVGGAEGEAPSVYLAGNGGAQRIATREIDLILAEYTGADLAGAVLDARIADGLAHLHVRLPRVTLVFDFAASASAAFALSLHSLTSPPVVSIQSIGAHRPNNARLCSGAAYFARHRLMAQKVTQGPP
jgi:hypothetical protein